VSQPSLVRVILTDFDIDSLGHHRQPKIGKLRLPALIDQRIVRLQVAMG
jgi:hypothetical protein